MTTNIVENELCQGFVLFKYFIWFRQDILVVAAGRSQPVVHKINLFLKTLKN